MKKKIRRRKKNKLSFSRIVAAIIIATISYFIYENILNPDVGAAIPAQVSLRKDQKNWWNESFAFRRKILIRNLDKPVKFSINHTENQIDLKMNQDGSDIKIIGNKNNDFKEVPFQIKNIDTVNTEIAFDPSDLNLENYYIYYGNKIVKTSNLISGDNMFMNSENSHLDTEESTLVSIVNTNTWVLKEKAKTKISLKISDFSKITDLNYGFFSIDDSTETYKFNLTPGTVNLEVNFLTPGEHSLFVILKDGNKSYKSNRVSFYVSNPVYVAWTIDWEGVDPSAAYIKTMEEISDKYSIPMTQFFNPRIMIHSGISASRKKDILDWVKMRHTKGDEIAMHMHMQHDMVEFAGVRPKENEIGWNNDFRGYDIPSTVYDYNEYLTILKWGKEMFSSAGLPEPKGFRAGGWFADVENLKAMRDAGFKYDSSGRKSFAIGSNEFIQPWELTNVSQPYYPSNANQSVYDPNDKIGILEIPNNGSDSYWSTADELINNFYLNYKPGTYLNEEIIVTYLSHPEWFDIDEPKLYTLFEELNKYRYELNRGPVIFVTLEDYLERTGK